MKLQLKRSNVIESGAAKEPTASQLEYGELAINYNTTDPAIFLKDSNNNVIRISGVGNIADDGQVELPASTTPPLNPEDGNLWYNSDDGRLYIYYNDGDSTQWVDASPDSWDPSSYPDVSDDTAQSNTLDDRYLMLNSANDPITGGLNITGGNVGIGTTSPASTLDVSGNAIIGETGGAEGGQITLRDSSGSSRGFLDISGTDVFRMFSTTADQDFIIGSFASNGNIYFYTNNQQRMRIDSGGNVGIGASSPVSKLQVAGDVNISGAANKFIGPTASEGSTAAAPTYSFSGQNTGMFLASDNNLGFSTDATERLRIDSSGNVGIGTSNPAKPLHINSAVDEILKLETNDNQTGNIYQSFSDSTGVIGSVGMFNNMRELRVNNLQDDGVFLVRTADTERMRVDSSGDVGIGTSNPSGPLHVYRDNSLTGGLVVIEQDGTGDAAIDFTLTGTREFVVGVDNSDGDKFKIAGSAGLGSDDRVTIDNLGNVGIGTGGPGAKVHVSGLGQSTSSINTGSNNSLLVADTGNALANGGSIVFGAAGGNWKFAGIKSLVNSGSNNTTGDLAFLTRRNINDATLTENFRCLYTGGITFNGDSASANALDDYEEGTWTPAIQNGTFTYTKQIGNYTKVGNIVNATMYISWTAASGTGAFSINLPLTSNGNSTNNRYAGTIGYHKGMSRADNVNLVFSNSGGQSTTFFYAAAANGSITSYGVQLLTSPGEIQATITYHAA